METTLINWSPLWISLQTAITTIIIVFFLGTLTAWWVLQQKSEVVKIIADGIFTLPLVLPPTVVGFLLLYILGSKRLVGRFFVEQFGLQIAFTWIATVITATVVSFPLMYKSAKAALEQIDPGLWLAGRSLGMTDWMIFWRIILPNALPGLVSGGVLSFARALGEFGATAMLAGNILGRTRTLPLAIYSEVAGGDMESAGWYASVIIVICFIMIIALNWYLHKCRQREHREQTK